MKVSIYVVKKKNVFKSVSIDEDIICYFESTVEQFFSWWLIELASAITSKFHYIIFLHSSQYFYYTYFLNTILHSTFYTFCYFSFFAMCPTHFHFCLLMYMIVVSNLSTSSSSSPSQKNLPFCWIFDFIFTYPTSTMPLIFSLHSYKKNVTFKCHSFSGH